MVQVQINIEVPESDIAKFSINLMKREDANDYEVQAARLIENFIKHLIRTSVDRDVAKVVSWREISSK